jgi:hypothetical protein
MTQGGDLEPKLINNQLQIRSLTQRNRHRLLITVFNRRRFTIASTLFLFSRTDLSSAVKADNKSYLLTLTEPRKS